MKLKDYNYFKKIFFLVIYLMKESIEPFYKVLIFIYLEDFKSYDSITHIFECYTNKINYISKSGIIKFLEKKMVTYVY